MNKYGYFDDARREYVVTSPFPPVPWINFLTNDNFTAIVSQSGGGSAFYREASTGRLTWYNQGRSVPVDRPGFYLYLREQDGTIWTPTFEPVRTKLGGWKCRHGLGYTVFEAEHKKLCATLTFFVPRHDNALLWDVRLENKRSEPVELTAFAFVEFSPLQAVRQSQYWHWCRFYSSTTFDAPLDAVKYDCHVYEDHPKLKVFFAANRPVAGFDCDRGSFMGRAGTLDAPESVVAGHLRQKQQPGGGAACGALENRLTLKPGEIVQYALTLGCELTWEKAAAIVTKYKDNATVRRELEAVRKYWEDFVGVYQAELPDPDMQRMINVWNPYNCSIAFNRKKSMTAATTGMEKGGVQSRDSSQDSMSLISLRTGLAKDRIALIYRYQHPTGEYLSTFDPDVTKQTPHYAVRSDNGVWPVFATHAYVCETGDTGFLGQKIPYCEGEPATVLEHMAQGLRHINRLRGKNGLPLIIDVDWNDNLYMFKETGQEESVMLAQQLVYAGRLLKELAGHNQPVVAFCDEVIREMTANLNQPGIWDGQWYARYIFATDKPAFGSSRRREGKIFLDTQVWAVISDTAQPKDRATLCMDHAHEMLGTKFGLKLLYPAFTGIPEPENPLYNNGPGIRENGGIFHHMHTWGVMAETILGRGDRAYEYYRQILPNVASQERGEDVYLNEPYAISSTTLIDPDLRAGEGDMAWFTGTVTWMYLVGTQYILGVRPALTGLLIDPCIPSKWDGYKVRRRYRGVWYTITVRNPDHVSKGVRSVKMDGKEVRGNILPEIQTKDEVDVEVVLGKNG